MVQVGSKDLHEGEIDNEMKEYESLVNLTMNMMNTYPDSEVVLGQILPRFKNDKLKTKNSKSKVVQRYYYGKKNIKF